MDLGYLVVVGGSGFRGGGGGRGKGEGGRGKGETGEKFGVGWGGRY